MKHNLRSFASLAVLVFAGWQAFTTLSNMPAFNRSLRVAAVMGGTEPALPQAMYHRGEYLYQIAHDWRAMAAEEVLRGGLAAMPAEEDMRHRSEQARDALTEGLRHAPANAYAWTLLAFAEHSLGKRDAALDALRASQALAAYDPRLAFRRMLFVGQMTSGSSEADVVGAGLSPNFVRQNADMLTRYYKAGRITILDLYPDLAGLFVPTGETR